MLISKDRQRYKDINVPKTTTGAFYTRGDLWMTSHVQAFIQSALAQNADAPGGLTAVDPFAGAGHLLGEMQQRFGLPTQGFDIAGYGGVFHDSLASIPPLDDAIIITNPPYLTNYSARRKGIYADVAPYFAQHGDLYQRALDNCRTSCRYTVAIVPETVLNSGFDKTGFVLVNIILADLFDDTQTPVCVVCIDNQKGDDDFDIYIDEAFACRFSKLGRYRQTGRQGGAAIRFNDPTGPLGLKAVDGTRQGDKIRFLTQFDYDQGRVRPSSRLMTYISIQGAENLALDTLDTLDALATTCNTLLQTIRDETHDVILSPFKGNNHDGTRRRRLDYRLARWIINQSLKSLDALGPVRQTMAL